MAQPADLTYGSYLRIPELLALQSPQSSPEHPEELHFIVVHQSIELWFKLLLHDLEQMIVAIDDDEWTVALVLLRRQRDVMDHLTAQMRSLEDMPPWSFHEFRSYLGTASGLQSLQFRELELLSGLRETSYLEGLRVMHDGALPDVLAARLAARSLAEAHLAAGVRAGVEDWSEFYATTGTSSALYLLCEALVDYDERWVRWRTDHLLLVERAVGSRARGTGGTAMSYLTHTARFRFFPYLWEARNGLSLRGGGDLTR